MTEGKARGGGLERGRPLLSDVVETKIQSLCLSGTRYVLTAPSSPPLTIFPSCQPQQRAFPLWAWALCSGSVDRMSQSFTAPSCPQLNTYTRAQSQENTAVEMFVRMYNGVEWSKSKVEAHPYRVPGAENRPSTAVNRASSKVHRVPNCIEKCAGKAPHPNANRCAENSACE